MRLTSKERSSYVDIFFVWHQNSKSWEFQGTDVQKSQKSLKYVTSNRCHFYIYNITEMRLASKERSYYVDILLYGTEIVSHCTFNVQTFENPKKH